MNNCHTIHPLHWTMALFWNWSRWLEEMSAFIGVAHCIRHCTACALWSMWMIGPHFNMYSTFQRRLIVSCKPFFTPHHAIQVCQRPPTGESSCRAVKWPADNSAWSNLPNAVDNHDCAHHLKDVFYPSTTSPTIVASRACYTSTSPFPGDPWLKPSALTKKSNAGMVLNLFNPSCHSSSNKASQTLSKFQAQFPKFLDLIFAHKAGDGVGLPCWTCPNKSSPNLQTTRFHDCHSYPISCSDLENTQVTSHVVYLLGDSASAPPFILI